MSTEASIPDAPASRRGTPVWELAELWPNQGYWTEEQYLALDTNRLIEFKDGMLEFLPVATEWHQSIAQFLFLLLHTFVLERGLGKVYIAPMRIQLRPGHYREPDVLFLTQGRRRGPTTPPSGADLVMEVISPGTENRERDEVEKRKDYADAGIPEYWLVDPEARSIQVLWLNGPDYEIDGEYGAGSRAKSRLLTGFEVSVDEVFNQV